MVPAARPPRPESARDEARPRGARGWLGRHWWPLALLAALTWLLLYPYSRAPWQGLASWGDPMLQHWTIAWAAHALATDPAHLFDANIFHPYPRTLAYSDHLLGGALPVLPVVWLTGNATLGLNLAVLLACFLSAAGAYLLVEDLTGNRLAGLAAALPFGFAPYKLGNLAHLHTLNSGWIALALWAILRLWRGGGWRWAVLLAFAILWQGLSSVYFFYALLVALGTVLLYLALLERRALTRPAAARLLAGLALGLLLSVPGFWPYWQVTRELGIARSLDEAMQWSADPHYYLAVAQNNELWSGVLRRFGSGTPERLLFPGIVAPLLALVGLLGSRRRERWLFGALVALGFLLTLGPYREIGDWRVPLPYWFLYHLVPGFTSMRVPTRFVILVLLGLAGLAGLGVEVLARYARSKGEGRRARGETTSDEQGSGHALHRPPVLRLSPLALRPSPLVAAAALVLLLGAYGLEYRSHLGMTGPVAGAIDAPVHRWLAENGSGPVAELPMPPLDKVTALTNLATTLHWRPVLGGQSGFVPPAYDGVERATARFPAPEALTLLQGLGVEHVVVHTDQYAPDAWRAAEAALRGEPRAREVARLGADVVYALAPDPWLERLAAAVPPGAPVVFPDVEGAPTELELLGVYLRRAGHAVSGSGAVSYHRFALPRDGRLPAHAVLAAGADPMLYGYLPEEARLTLNGLTLYEREAPARATTMFSDQALPRSTGAQSFTALRLEAERVELVNWAERDARPTGEQLRSALVAFVNSTPGEVTIRYGGETRREALPAGLIVYRTPPLPTPSTIRVEAPTNSWLAPRWARIEAPVAGRPTGLVAARPVVMIGATVRRAGDATVVVGCTILPGAADPGDDTPYTLTLDIYRRPYGSHPEGHYGYWTVFVPPGDAVRHAELTFDIERREATGTLDGAWTSIASWSGEPRFGPYRATLVIGHGDRVLGSVSLFEFELQDWRARHLDLRDQPPLFLPPTR